MKKILAFLIAAIMVLSMMPMTAGAADESLHPIVKGVVEFNGQYVASENYFAFDGTLYDRDGKAILTLGNESEMLYTLTDHCMITVWTYGDEIDEIEYGFNLFTIEDNEVKLKSSFENDPIVIPFEGMSYTAVLHADIIGILLDPSISEDMSSLPIFGYDIIDEYGNVVYSVSGQKIASPVADGVFIEGELTLDTEAAADTISHMLTVTDDGVKRIDFEYPYGSIEQTELGDLLITSWECSDGEEIPYYGVIDYNGNEVLPPIYDDIFVTDEYYISSNYEFTVFEVYDKSGNIVYISAGSRPVVYYNGKIAIIAIEKTSYGASTLTYKLIDVETNKVIAEAPDMYEDGGYIFVQGIEEDGSQTLRVYDSEGARRLSLTGVYPACVDEGNSTIVMYDESSGNIFRLNAGCEALHDSYPSNAFVISSKNKLSVMMDYSVSDDYVDFSASTYLWYNGEKITRDNTSMFVDSFTAGNCDVYIFMNELTGEEDEYYYSAYIIDAYRLPFYDVYDDYWAIEYIDKCYKAGIMNGVGDGRFSPGYPVTRAQVVTTLWRLAGEPEAENNTSGMRFTDVSDGTWYTEAVAWAAENGITSGVGGSCFAPDRTVTRGEVAAILYRYAEYTGADVTVDKNVDLSSFADSDKLTDWNRDAFAWCVSEGIINGRIEMEGYPIYLAPTDALKRAEIAAILCRCGI